MKNLLTTATFVLVAMVTMVASVSDASAATLKVQVTSAIMDDYPLPGGGYYKTRIKVRAYENYSWRLEDPGQETPANCDFNGKKILPGCADNDGRATFEVMPGTWYLVEAGATGHFVTRQQIFVPYDGREVQAEFSLKGETLSVYQSWGELQVQGQQVSGWALICNNGWRGRSFRLTTKINGPGTNAFSVEMAQNQEYVWMEGWNCQYHKIQANLPPSIERVPYGDKICADIVGVDPADILKTLGRGEVCGVRQ